MKVIGVIGSPHARDYGATLVREALRGAEKAGASITEVFLPNYRIEYCRDCGACMKNLFDRLGQYAFLTSTFGGRYVVGLATPGRGARWLPTYSAAGAFLTRTRSGGFQQALFLRPLIKQANLNNREAMNGVYKELVRRGIFDRDRNQAA